MYNTGIALPLDSLLLQGVSAGTAFRPSCGRTWRRACKQKQGPALTSRNNRLSSGRAMNTGKFDCKNRFCTIIKKNYIIISGMDLSRESFTNKKSSSLLYYTPKSQMDYGTVLCVASNIVGRQIVPCIYHVIPAGMTHFLLLHTWPERILGSKSSK